MRNELLSNAPLAACGCIAMILMLACSNGRYDVIHPPNYDNLIGTKFSESVYKGRQVYRRIGESEKVEELQNRRSDGCLLTFGVRKVDDIIEYWRVDSGPGTCLVRKTPLNR
jgi:hypothetical protein